MSKVRKQAIKKDLRILSPKLYHFIVNELAEHHIHAYDLLLNGQKTDTETVEVTIRFGDGFAQAATESFSFEMIESLSSEVSEFANTTAETCKKTLKADYFKRMAP